MSIMESINIGSNALKAHGLRLDIHAKNIANVDTPNYVRKIPVLNAGEDISFHGVMNAMKEDVFGTGTLPYLQGGVVFNGCVEVVVTDGFTGNVRRRSDRRRENIFSGTP